MIFEKFISIMQLHTFVENIRDLELCGRPLGLAFDVSPNHLIVADSYYGIWQVDISNGKKVALVSPSEVIGEKVNVLFKYDLQKYSI